MNEISLSYAFAVIRRRLGIVFFIFMVSVSLVILAVGSMANRYNASAVVILNADGAPVSSIDGVHIQTGGEAINAEAEAKVLLSEALLKRLAADMTDRYGPREERPGLRTAVHEVVGLACRHLPLDCGTREATVDPIMGWYDALGGNLAVRADTKNSSLIVSYTDTAPERVAEVTNQAVRLYLDSRREARDQALNGTIGALEERMQQMAEEIRGSADRLAAMREELGHYETSSGTILAQRIVAATQALAEASIRLSEARLRHAQIAGALERGGRGERIDDRYKSQKLHELLAMENALQTADAQLAVKLGALHPQRQQLDGQRQKVGALVQVEGGRILGEARDQVAEAERRYQQMDGELAALKGQTRPAILAQTSVSVGLSRVEGLLASYNLLNRQLEQYHLMRHAGERVRVAAWATPPMKPALPNRTMAVVLAAAVIGVLCLIGAVVDAVLRGVIISAGQVRAIAPEVFTLPRLGMRRRRQPLIPLNGRRLATDEAVMRRVQDIALWTLLQRPGGVLSVSVTSAFVGEGKTTTSVLLAQSFASLGYRTLLIDADPFKNSASRYLQSVSGEGDGRTLVPAGKHGELVCQDTPCPNVAYTQVSRTFSDLIGRGDRHGLRAAIEELGDFCDVVVFDTPPLMPVTETVTIAAAVTRNLVVADWRHARLAQLRRVNDLCAMYGAAVSAVVLNKCERSSGLVRLYGRYGRYPRLHGKGPGAVIAAE